MFHHNRVKNKYINMPHLFIHFLFRLLREVGWFFSRLFYSHCTIYFKSVNYKNKNSTIFILSPQFFETGWKRRNIIYLYCYFSLTHPSHTLSGTHMYGDVPGLCLGAHVDLEGEQLTQPHLLVRLEGLFDGQVLHCTLHDRSHIVNVLCGQTSMLLDKPTYLSPN